MASARSTHGSSGWPSTEVARYRSRRTSRSGSCASPAGLLAFGVDTLQIEGVPVRVTSPARTVADCFKFRNRVSIDVAVEALREYLLARKGPPDDLWHCAERLRVLTVIRPYGEALST